MNERREFLAKIATATAGLLMAGMATGAVARVLKKKPARAPSADETKLYGPGRIPEMRAETSAGKPVRLYADLIKGKVVLINFMAIDNESRMPVVGKTLELARRLGPKLGTEVHFISITSDPLHDTPARLRAFEKRMGVPAKGWTFVRVAETGSVILNARLHQHPMAPNPHARMSVTHYGNEPVGLWGMFPTNISPEDALLRIASILPGKPVTGAPRRAGPRKLGAPGMSFNNRIA